MRKIIFAAAALILTLSIIPLSGCGGGGGGGSTEQASTTNPNPDPGTNPGTTNPNPDPGTNPGTTNPNPDPGTNPGTPSLPLVNNPTVTSTPTATLLATTAKPLTVIEANHDTVFVAGGSRVESFTTSGPSSFEITFSESTEVAAIKLSQGSIPPTIIELLINSGISSDPEAAYGEWAEHNNFTARDVFTVASGKALSFTSVGVDDINIRANTIISIVEQSDGTRKIITRWYPERSYDGTGLVKVMAWNMLTMAIGNRIVKLDSTYLTEQGVIAWDDQAGSKAIDCIGNDSDQVIVVGSIVRQTSAGPKEYPRIMAIDPAAFKVKWTRDLTDMGPGKAVKVRSQFYSNDLYVSIELADGKSYLARLNYPVTQSSQLALIQASSSNFAVGLTKIFLVDPPNRVVTVDQEAIR